MTPLGITNESLRALNFGAIINKVEKYPNLSIISGKHVAVKLGQAKHSGNVKIATLGTCEWNPRSRRLEVGKSMGLTIHDPRAS